MRRPERRWGHGLAAALSLAACSAARPAEPEARRYAAPITIEQPAAFVRIALPPAAYAHAARPDLRDLQVVDAAGERVPFALLPARSSLGATEQRRDAVLYPLPARPAAGGTWASPIEVVVQGERISVRRHGEATTPDTPAAAAAARGAGGWLIDLGDARPGDLVATRLALQWSGTADFSVGYRLETSADLQRWQPGGAGQLLALQSNGGALTQPVVALPDGAARFVRLLWNEPRDAPRLTGATALASEPPRSALDNPALLTLAPVAAGNSPAATDDDTRRALVFDLGAPLPIVDLALRFGSGTHIAPVRVQGRDTADAPWRALGSGVFYRLERGGTADEAPALALSTSVRFLRLLPDPRAAALPADATRLVVHAALASLLFAQQGTPPFRLLAGAPGAADSALPLTTLVPLPEEERARFGRAGIGDFGVVEAAARQADRDARAAALRPWWLWGVLLAGVGLLALGVWRLATTRPAPPA